MKSEMSKEEKKVQKKFMDEYQASVTNALKKGRLAPKFFNFTFL